MVMNINNLVALLILECQTTFMQRLGIGALPDNAR
jgi:hypothetical protein